MSTLTSANLKTEYDNTEIESILRLLDEELIGLLPVKKRIREIAALLLVDKMRQNLGLTGSNPGLHMSFTGSPGTGKTTVALKMADILYKLDYCRKGHLLTVTRDDLVGQYIGHTAPKTKEVLKKAMGGVLFIDEAYYLYKPDNERDYGSEAIEILLQVMENQRDDLVVILAGYKEKMDVFYASNPGLSSRITNHVHFPDFLPEELLQIGINMIEEQQYQLTPDAERALLDYIKVRMTQPLFANARSVRNALDRARMRQANRVFETEADNLTKRELVTIEAPDLLQSRVFSLGTQPAPPQPEYVAPTPAPAPPAPAPNPLYGAPAPAPAANPLYGAPATPAPAPVPAANPLYGAPSTPAPAPVPAANPLYGAPSTPAPAPVPAANPLYGAPSTPAPAPAPAPNPLYGPPPTSTAPRY